MALPLPQPTVRLSDAKPLLLFKSGMNSSAPDPLCCLLPEYGLPHNQRLSLGM